MSQYVVIPRADLQSVVCLDEWARVLLKYGYTGEVGNAVIEGFTSLVLIVPGITKEDFEKDIADMNRRGGEDK